MITLTIKMASIVEDIKAKSFMNTERVKDPADQYALRAGEEKESEIAQGLQDSWRSLVALVRRFLQVAADTAGNDALPQAILSADKTLAFDVTSRRASNIAQPLAQAVHEYLVSGTLRRFYTSAAMADLASMYAANEKAAADNIAILLYRKSEPIYT